MPPIEFFQDIDTGLWYYRYKGSDGKSKPYNSRGEAEHYSLYAEHVPYKYDDSKD